MFVIITLFINIDIHVMYSVLVLTWCGLGCFDSVLHLLATCSLHKYMCTSIITGICAHVTGTGSLICHRKSIICRRMLKVYRYR